MYKQYERYKDSGVEWIGEIPEHWKINKVKRTTFVKGRIGWQGLRADEFLEHGPYLVTGTDFIKGAIKWETCYHISQERFNEAPEIQLREDDLLITKDGTIGKVALVKYKPDRAILNSGVFVTRPRHNRYLQKFMFWILNSIIFYEFIKYMELGSTIKHLYQATFERMPYFLPGIDEQKTIANFLDHKTSEIDSLIDDKEELIKKLEEYKQSIITEAVTKGLNPNVKMKDSGIEWIGEVPEHWDYFALKRLAVFRSGDTINSESIEPEGEYPVYGGNGLRGYTSEYTNEGHYILIGRQGALCGNINYASGQFWASEHAVVVYPTKNITIKWFGELLRSMNLNQYSVSAAQPGLSVNNIVNLRIPVPPKEEQYDIANYIDSSLCDIDSLVEFVNDAINKLKQYRQSLIYEAVTGKIDVRDYQTERSEQHA